ncbi:hypothetical protein SAMN05216266_105273 [Amycolatopsis marina]|uniref:Uncharacterized protein n=1 Tax=Amycolatopsis marina TaxID=490629 RepID=A0A1I0YRE3_9PSEU|nr:DUF6223 family protein [Amycolatopsis marina]SFB15771.1 hypothetical protein SAMN05216266_105273 [Amycolatopsis marina]
MSVRHLLAAADVYALSAGRIWAFVAAFLGLTAVALGGLALLRFSRTGTGFGPRGTIVATVAGLLGIVIGGLVVLTADGGLGTGNGLGGGVVASVLGLTGILLIGLALARSRRNRPTTAHRPQK